MFAVGMAGLLMTIPGQTIGVSAFIDYLIDAVQISRDQISLAYLFGTLTSAFSQPFAGRLYDRIGSRKTGFIAAAGLGISLLALVTIPQITEGFISIGIAPAVSVMISFWFGFFLIRFFGQGLLTNTSRNMILKWFDDRRGFANALLGIGLPLGFAAAPTILNYLIMQAGWQGAWFILGLLLFPFFALIVLFFYSDPPATSSRHPENDVLLQEEIRNESYGVNTAPIPLVLKPLAVFLRKFGLSRTREGMRPRIDISLAEARRSLSFWLFLGTISLSSLLSTGFTFHVVAILGEAGIERVQALAIFLPVSFIQIIVHSLGSMGSDFAKLKYFLIAHSFSMFMILLSIVLLNSIPGAYWMLVLFSGISIGLFGINSAVVWPRFYGLKYLGEISGMASAWVVAGSALGPYLFSLMYTLSGSFYTVFYVLGPIALVLGILGFKADNPSSRQDTQH